MRVAKSIHSDPYRALLDLVRSLRLDAGLSQTELAGRLGRPQTFISKVELGERRLDLEELRQICNALDQDLLDVVARWMRAIGDMPRDATRRNPRTVRNPSSRPSGKPFDQD